MPKIAIDTLVIYLSIVHKDHKLATVPLLECVTQCLYTGAIRSKFLELLSGAI